MAAQQEQDLFEAVSGGGNLLAGSRAKIGLRVRIASNGRVFRDAREFLRAMPTRAN